MIRSDLQSCSLEFVKRLQRYLQRNDIDAFFVADLPNVRYLTTFSGTSGFCVIFPDASYFLTDFRYETQAASEVISCEILVFSGSVIEFLRKRFFKKKIPRKLRIGVEDNLAVGTFEEMNAKLSPCKLVKTSNVIEKIASVKAKPEIMRIKSACSVSESALHMLMKEKWVGCRETELSAKLEFNQKVIGAAKESFDTIVASGWRGALPHGVASQKVIELNELVTLDFGCYYDGYVSDITRTFQTGKKIDPELLKIYRIVVDAQRKGVEAARAGVRAAKVDRAAREYIEKKGYGKYFGHSLGHGIGLRIHELPRISQKSHDTLLEGNVVTIEPGIYIPNLGGVRIEDDFLVTKDGVEQLSSFPKDLRYYLEHV
jgi:Xaa-Pro aminopeptidase